MNKIQQSKIFEVYEEQTKRGIKLFTLNLVKNFRISEEKLVNKDNNQFREWDPYSSKLASLILKGCPNTGIRKGDLILYLGCASGTTVSYCSDIVGKEGFIYAVDIAPRVMRNLVFVSEVRKNIAPILADANKPEKIIERVSQVDVLYQDIAQKNQVQIFLKNVDLFLKEKGYALLVIKARSIDVTKNPKDIFKQVRAELEKELIIIDSRILDPYQRDHCMFVCKK